MVQTDGKKKFLEMVASSIFPLYSDAFRTNDNKVNERLTGNNLYKLGMITWSANTTVLQQF